MFFSSLIRWFYCLPVSTVLLAAVFAVFLFFQVRKILSHSFWWPWGCLLFLLFWTGCVLWMTLFSRGPVPEPVPPEPLLQSYRKMLREQNPEILRSNLMNLILFFPAGVLLAQLLPRAWPKGLRVAAAVLMLVLFSGGIEYFQYRHHLGQAEADDILHNGAGALLGVLSDQLFSYSSAQ